MTDDTHARQSNSESNDERVGRLGRRDYLRAIGTGASMGPLGAQVSATASARSDDWEAAADQRIAQHRQGTLAVQVVDERGQPVADADVSVEMREHEFTFGCGVSAPTLLGEDEAVTQADVEQYRSAVTELFNTGVLTNHHKWRFWEDNQQTADEATAWLLDQGLDVRGHTCLWGNVEAWAIPADVVDAMGVDHPSGASGPTLDPEHVRQRSLEHMEAIISHYADFEYDGESYGSVIDQWDVVNEAVHQTRMIEAVDGEDVDPVEAPILADWYERATEVAPDDVALDVNDYNVLSGPYQSTRDTYQRQIDFLHAADGVVLDGAGLQCHFGPNETLTPEQTLAALDQYARHDVDIRITEFDITGEDWSDDDQVTFLSQFLKTVFSHEAVEDFLVWDFWGDNAPLYRSDWSTGPAYDAYTGLVFDEWWTSESGSTDSQGTVAVEAFLGEHEVTVSTNRGSTARTVSVTDPGTTRQITVTVDGNGTAGPPQVGDNASAPTDPDGDGLYEDLNGNGRLDSDDVVSFFEDKESSDVQNNPDRYDFNDNGRIDYDDVVALFEEL